MSPAYAPRSPAETALRAHGLAYPETKEDFPWGHRALKVRGKIFAIFGWDGERFSLSAKLPQSNLAALDRPFAEPTGYGMGKHGWVTARFEPGERVPVELLQSWIDESFRAIAPKTVVEALDGGARGATTAAATRAPKRAVAPKGGATPKRAAAPRRSSTPKAGPPPPRLSFGHGTRASSKPRAPRDR